MLTRVKESEIEKINELLSASPAFNVRLCALLKAYGTRQPFFNVWRQDFDFVVARLENSFFISANKNVDFEEIAFFLRFNPYFHRLVGESSVAAQVAAYLGGDISHNIFDCMAYNGKIEKESLNQFLIESCADLKAVYEVMKSSESGDFTVSEFMPWYADVSHRIRHGCARAYLLRTESEPVSVCLVSAESDSVGLISGVATKPDFRGRGFASAVTLQACSDLRDCGKLPVLECLPALASYYGRVGFEKAGTVTVLDITNT